MKLLVFAHKPPPHHGQSFMVGLLIKVLTEAPKTEEGESSEPIEVFHVDARLSDELSNVGQARFGKLFRLLGFCAKAIFWRFRFGVKTLYYVPAPPHRVAILRDWIAMGICRPFFKTTIYHWHASGLGQWLQNSAGPWEKRLSSWTITQPELSIVLRPGNRFDAEALQSKQIEVIPYGIPDPCPQFEQEIKPRRIARSATRSRMLQGIAPTSSETSSAGGDPQVFRILFMSLCVREKGLFDLIEAVARLGSSLKGSELRVELAVAGAFVTEAERLEFERRIRCPDLAEGKASVRYCEFVSGAEKGKLFAEADCFCFPTYYAAESFGLVLIEAMAFGLPVVVSNWRGIPELLPQGYPWIASPRCAEELAAQLRGVIGTKWDDSLRAHFLKTYLEEKFAEAMRAAILGAKANVRR